MEILLRRHDLQLAHNWMVASSQRTGGKRVHGTVIVELRDDAAGIVGYGEASPSLRYNETAEGGMAFLKRVDAFQLSFEDVPNSADYIESLGAGELSAKGAVNLALLDGAAKLARQPLHDFLGLPFEERKHVTSFTIGLDTPETMRAKALEAVAYPILKIKVGGPNDVKNLAAVRSVAPTKTLRLDANEGWLTPEEALRHIEELARDPHIEFIEQPMPSTLPRESFTWLKERSPLPLIADESYLNATDAAHCAECFHGVNVKLAKTGGVLHAQAALLAARQAGLKTMIGSMVESSILTAAGAHLAALADWLDLDGMLLITNDPFRGISAHQGVVSFANSPEPFGLQVRPR